MIQLIFTPLTRRTEEGLVYLRKVSIYILPSTLGHYIPEVTQLHIRKTWIQQLSETVNKMTRNILITILSKSVQ